MDGETVAAGGGVQAKHAFQYDGRVGTLYGIWLLNIVLNVVTLGIYSFWGRTRVRRYAVASFALDGDRLEYTGTGGELFKGFLKALPLIIILYLPLILYPAQQYPLVSLMFIPIIYFVYVGLYAALRYRLSRTTWRGIRGRLTGSAFKYGAIAMGAWLATIFSAGVMIPWADRLTTRYLMSHVWFGNTQAEFTHDPDGLWRMHVLTFFVPLAAALAILILLSVAARAGFGSTWHWFVVLIAPLIIFSRFWYMAALRRFQFNNLRIGGLRFAADYTGGNFVGLMLGNGAILLFTLGLGYPFVINRNFAFLARHISFSGDLNAAAAEIRQSQEALSQSGEGLDGIVGMDSGLL